jgi:hypothetical protein
MSEIGYGAAIALAVVLLVAGIAKLRDPVATTKSFGALGLPSPRLLSTLVPLAELLAGAGLVVAPKAAALGALVLLSAFSAVLVRGMRGGVQGCGCFGATTIAPLSAADLVRNGLLVGAAFAALAAPAPDPPGLAAVVVVSTAAVLGAVAIALVRLRVDVGSVWVDHQTRIRVGEPVVGG